MKANVTVALTVTVMIVGATSSVEGALVYGIQATTGRILTVDPSSGAVVNSFATPQAIASTDVAAGLTYANDIGELLYFNQDGSPSNTLYRLNPSTGAIIATAAGDTFPNSGLSYEQIGGTNFLYYAHTSSDMHRQTNFGGGVAFFFGPGAPSSGVGGDGYGRLFAAYTDGLIHELDPSTGALIGPGFAAPAGIRGLAFDGTSLYASTSGGQLLTLNPNTGATLNSVTIAGGQLIEIGASAGSASVPEPATLALWAMGSLCLGVVARRRATQAA